MTQTVTDLPGRVSLVTGGAHGIGRGICLEFASQAMKIVLADIDMSAAESVAQQIRDSGGEALAVGFDLGDERACERLVDTAMAHFSRIDVLVNNASVWSNKPLFHSDPVQRATWSDFDRACRVNLIGTTFLSKRVADEMKKNPTTPGRCRGVQITITSIHDTVIRRHHLDYPVTKAGQRAMIRELACELASAQIRVNGIAPGATETVEDTVASNRRTPNGFIPLGGHTALPFEIARAALFLVSDWWSGYITGQIITVAGGLDLHSHWLDLLPPGTNTIIRHGTGLSQS